MTKQVDVGLFFGESFYEVILTERHSEAILFSGSFFNIKDPFKTKFPKILQSLQDIEIKSTFIGYRYLERIFKFKLGGSVAQIVTKGFENWLSLHQQNKKETLFSLKAPPDLSSHDMIFSIDEKIDSSGNIQKSLSLDEVHGVLAGLKKKEAKRVCLNLVNSEKNTHHQNQLKQILEENKFEVFDPLELGTESDVCSWRSSLIEASLAGTFNEMKSEILEALSPFTDASTIHFITNNHGKKKARNILSGLFAIEDAFFIFAKNNFNLPDQFDVVHLGLENFSIWLNESSPWESPWGDTSVYSKKRIDLKVQPTNSFHLNYFKEIEISASEESFEPGPMSLGRGQVPCVFDILNYESVSTELQKKIKDSFWALARSANQKASAETMLEDFRRIIWDRILIEASLLVTNETVVIYGNTSPALEAHAKEYLKNKNLIFISQKDFPKSWLALLRGRLEVQ